MARALRRVVGTGVVLAALAGAVAWAGAGDDGRLPPRGLPDFDLVDAAGRPWSLERFPDGSVLVVYFGYMTCLRACPTALDNIAAAVEQLGADAASVRPVFIDIDPERADPVNLAFYMEAFGPGFLGLSGTGEAVAAAARAFGVTTTRLRFSREPGDYAMTHQAPIFVLRTGEPRPVELAATSSPEAIASALRQALAPPG
jgi:protein SCO1/2